MNQCENRILRYSCTISIKKVLLLFLLSLTCISLYAQHANFDSLKKALAKKSPTDTSRISILNQYRLVASLKIKT